MANRREAGRNKVLADVDLLIKGRGKLSCINGDFPVYYLFRHLKRRGFNKKYKLEVDSSYCIMHISRGKLEAQIFLNGEDAFSRGFTFYTC
jgi:hypothetical protein